MKFKKIASQVRFWGMKQHKKPTEGLREMLPRELYKYVRLAAISKYVERPQCALTLGVEYCIKSACPLALDKCEQRSCN